VNPINRSFHTVCEIFEQFKSVLIGLVQIVRDLAASFNEALEKGGLVRDIMELISRTARGLTASIAALIAAFKEMWAAAVFAVQSMASAMAFLGAAITDAGSLNFSKIKDDFNGFTRDFTAEHQAYGAAIVDSNKKMIDEWQTIFASGDKKIEEEHERSMAHMAAGGTGNAKKPKTDNSALETAKKEIDGEIKMLQRA
jgi:hypothetical protein